MIGSDGTYVKVQGQEVGVQVAVDDRDSALLALEIRVPENTREVLGVVRTVAEQVQAEVLVSDDLDTYKRVADHRLAVGAIDASLIPDAAFPRY